VTRLIVGCGYLGLRVARRWLAAGQKVAGVVHSDASATALAAASVRPIVADVTRPETLRDLPAADALLYCVGYGADSNSSRWAVYVDGLRAVLDAVPPEVRRVIFVSSTGVYAEQDGGWVDEDSPCAPSRESGRALLAAEQVLAAHRLGERGIVLRLAGIYGPGRLPGTVPSFAERTGHVIAGRESAKMGLSPLTRGEPLAIPAGQSINLIHVDDAASAVLAAEARARPPRTYIVADGHPVDRREYFTELARQLGLQPPCFRDPRPGEAATRRGGDKRACSRRMLEELQVKLEYPTYREGIKAAVELHDD
jgi:nucleoside-diphosphate-sugar epimerase